MNIYNINRYIIRVDVNEWTVVNDSGVKIVSSVVVGGFAFAVVGLAISKLVVSTSINSIYIETSQ